MVEGDFNARVLGWGMPHPDSSRKRILKMVAKTGVVVINTWFLPMFPCLGCKESIPNVTFASESMAPLAN